jgi:hypothetical protein
MTVTYEDIVQARIAARREGLHADHVELTDAAIETLTDDLVAAKDISEPIPRDTDTDAEAVGSTTGIEVVAGQQNVLVTESGSEVQL